VSNNASLVLLVVDTERNIKGLSTHPAIIMNNTTSRFSLHTDSLQTPYEFKAVFFVAIFVVGLASLIGNTLVSITFVESKNLRTSTNYYITSMAMSDLLYGATLWGLFSSSRLSVFGPSLSSFGCKLGNYLWLVSYSVSNQSLVLISVDRFIATVFPMKVTMISGRIRTVLICLAWILPTVIGFPFLYFSRVADEPERPFLCVINMTREVVITYNAVGFVLNYCVPLVVIIILNACIMKSLRSTNPAIQGNGHSNTRRRKRNQRITKILLSINVFFFICWTGHYICTIILKLFPTAFNMRDQEILFISLYYFLPLVSTAFNPVMLFTFSSNYRQALRDCLLLVIVKCRSSFILRQVHVEALELTEAAKTKEHSSKKHAHVNRSTTAIITAM